ncbi:hypothetical protein [Nocardioides sp.]|uniref:hypothetical protein n=1 Tax=Nocardioides sp. TaxID=35761 RepID=UPI0039E5C33B
MRLRRLLRRATAPLVLVTLLMLACGPSADADGVYYPSWPGLPNLTVPTGWAKSKDSGDWATGLTEVARARQWLKVPAQATALLVLQEPVITYPTDDPQGRKQTTTYRAYTFLSSPAGATDGYGIGMPITVRTVAFGAVPVEVGLRIEQLRDEDDLPVALEVAMTVTGYYPATPVEVRPGVTSTESSSARLTGQVRVRLTALAVDGIDVGLGDCVSPPISLDLTSNTAWKSDPLTDPDLDPEVAATPSGSTARVDWLAARGLAKIMGGAVSGQLEIPAFSDCRTTAGEDVSPLLTGAVSGPGNAVTVGYAAVSSLVYGYPADRQCGTVITGTSIMGVRGPFQGDPSDCDPDYAPPTFSYPAREE